MPADPQIRGACALPCAARHYSVREISEAWGISDDLVRKIFEHEPGVIAIARSNGRKRKYVTLRVPEIVLERVHRRLQAGRS